MQLQFLAQEELFFKQLNGCIFHLGGIIIFEFQFSRAWFVMSAIVSRMEHSTIVEFQRLETEHIMKCTCSRLFFVRNMNTDIHIHIHIQIHLHVYIHARVHVHVRVRVCLCVFCCVVPCHVACRALLVGWLGVVSFGVVWCVVVDGPWSFLASYDEYIASGKSGAFNDLRRRVGQFMECVVSNGMSRL